MRYALLILLAGWLGCAHDVTARFPSAPDEPTGTLVLLLSDAASGVSVAVNGVLVVEDEHTRKVTLTGLPTGGNEIAIAANGSDKQLRAWITSEHPTTIPLGVPEAGMGFVKTIAGTLISILAYSLLH